MHRKLYGEKITAVSSFVYISATFQGGSLVGVDKGVGCTGLSIISNGLKKI